MRIRPNRIAEEIKREVVDIIRKDIKDPRIGPLVSVTSVEVTNDLRYAKVFVSSYGNSEERANTLKGLEKAAGFIRSELSKRMNLRYMPEIIFKMDDSLEYGAKIEAILNDIQKNEEDL